MSKWIALISLLLVSVVESKSIEDVIKINEIVSQNDSVEDVFQKLFPEYYTDLNQVQQYDDVQQASSLSVTYPGIGTFHANDFYDLTRRPLLTLPMSPESINTKFLLYTRKNPTTYDLVKQGKLDTIKKSHFNKNAPTKFIIHGWIDNQLFGPWMRQLKDEFLMKGDYNVFIVDWSGGNFVPYGLAVVNTRVVGAVVGNLINELQAQFGISPSSVHLMGHSLGGQIVGYAGERLNGKIGRITGLDPAGPFFEDLPPAVRLDPTDAQFVDVIHSNAKPLIPYLGLGTRTLSGHVDFFPNGGENQPGCKEEGSLTTLLTKGIFEGIRRLTACHHQRAVDFFMASVNHEQNVPVGYHCSDYDSFKQGLCTDCGTNGEKCAILGYRADEYKNNLKARSSNKGGDKRLFLQTGEKYPYFMNEYQITIKLGSSGSLFSNYRGSVTVKLEGSTTSVKGKIFDNEKLSSGSHSGLLNAPNVVGDIKKVSLSWKRSGLLNILKKTLTVQSITIHPLLLNKNLRSESAKTFCGKSVTEGSEVTFSSFC